MERKINIMRRPLLVLLPLVGAGILTAASLARQAQLRDRIGIDMIENPRCREAILKFGSDLDADLAHNRVPKATDAIRACDIPRHTSVAQAETLLPYRLALPFVWAVESSRSDYALSLD